MRFLLITYCLATPTVAFCADEYDGTSFLEVRGALFGTPAESSDPAVAEEMAVYQKGLLPHYKVTASKFVTNGVDHLVNAAKRTTTQSYDLYPRIEKLLHSNGICFTGDWKITEPSSYSGFFETGARGLFVGRWSVASTETTRGFRRGFGLAGKVFPTQNPREVVKTGNFLR